MRHLEVWFATRKKVVFYFSALFSMLWRRHWGGSLWCPCVPHAPGWAGQQQVGAGAVPVLVRVCAALVSAMLKTCHFCPFFSSKTWCDSGGAVWAGEETCCIPHPAVMQSHGQGYSESLRSVSWQEKSGFYCVSPPQPVASTAPEPPAGGAVRHRQRGGREPPAAHAVFPTWYLLPAVCHKQNKFCLTALKLNLV